MSAGELAAIATVVAFFAGILWAYWRDRDERAADEVADRTRWEQVSALHFRKVEDLPGGLLVLKHVHFPDSPFGRADADGFAAAHGIATRVRHTRE